MALRLRRKFALIGVAVAVLVVCFWQIDRAANLFHLPTWEQAPPNYRQPPLRQALETLSYVLCPGLLTEFFAIGIDAWFSWVIWGMAVLLNAPIYYGVGVGIEALVKRRMSSRQDSMR